MNSPKHSSERSSLNSRARLKANKETWDKVADQFYGHSCLPVMGAFGEGKGLVEPIKGKIFLELCCGSGHSIKYLADHGAKKVYGLDLSKTQTGFARDLNKESIEEGTVTLFNVPMEQRLPLRNVDTVYSIYGLGWTVDPDKVIRNVYSYLKKGGRFIFSWDHAFFHDIVFEGSKFVVKNSYHDQEKVYRPGWYGGKGAYLTYYKTSTWFNFLRRNGFTILDYLEPKPLASNRSSLEKKSYYFLGKARLIPATIIFVCQK